MRLDAERLADVGGDAFTSESLGRIRAERLKALAADPDAPPFFGRIDRDRSDDAGDPVVIDWRAPISRSFYRATPADRMGVRLRRRFGFHGSSSGVTISSYEDEHLD